MSAKREPTIAEAMGIIIGKTIRRIDWHASGPTVATPSGAITERINPITRSAGDVNWNCIARHFVCQA